jgi:hypothetical protein
MIIVRAAVRKVVPPSHAAEKLKWVRGCDQEV